MEEKKMQADAAGKTASDLQPATPTSGKKVVIWSVVLIIITILTVKIILSGSDISLMDLIESLKSASPAWLAVTTIATLCYILFEGEALICIAKEVGYPQRHINGFLYGAGDVYFSAITPSATGGQPASAYFMMRDGIPGPITVVALIVNLIMYTLAVLTTGLIAVIFKGRLLGCFELPGKLLIAASTAILIGMVVVFYLFLKKKNIVFAISWKITRILHKLHIVRDVEKRKAKLEKKAEEYEACYQFISGRTGMLVKVYIFNLLQRVSQIFVTAFVHMAIGGAAADFWNVLGVQAFVTLGSYCIPMPGAIGVADYLLIGGFKGYFTENADYAYRLSMISRGFYFYLCIMVSLVVVIIGYLFLRNKTRKQGGQESTFAAKKM